MAFSDSVYYSSSKRKVGCPLNNILILEKDSRTANMYEMWIEELQRKINVQYFSDEAEAYEYAISNRVDLFILGDRGSMDMYGYNFADKLRASRVHEMAFIIFVSSEPANKHLAYEDLKCYHYFTEPVNKHEFKRILTKCLKYQITNTKKEYIKLYHNKATTKVPLDKIVWLEIVNKHITLHSKESVLMQVSSYHYPLEELERLLGEGFVRIHQSIIINKDYIDSVDYANKMVHVTRSKRSPVGEVQFKMGITYIKKVKEQWG